MKNVMVLSAALLAGLFSGCATAPTPLAGNVGPDLSVTPVSGPDGYLKVYTATQTVEVDFKADFKPHMGYQVTDTAGHKVEFVPNHTSNLDESPDVVALRPGSYDIVAESATCGLLKVAVTIERGRTTIVHLDGSSPFIAKAYAKDLVYLPNGQAVGWSAPAPR